MITAKTLSLIVAYCAAWNGFPHYKQEKKMCSAFEGTNIINTGDCEIIMVNSDMNSDESELCQIVVRDCVKDLGSFKKCKNGKWKWYGGNNDANLKDIVDEIANYQYAPDDVRMNFKKERVYFWRKK